MLSSSNQAELVMAIAETVVLELPLAVVCLLVACSAKHRLRLQAIALVREPSEAGSAVGTGRRAA